MTSYRICANGTEMGIFEGTDHDDAVEAYARDAGYESFADLLDRVPGSTRDEVEVEEAYRIEVRGSEGWEPAPGDAEGWSLSDAEGAVESLIAGETGDEYARDDVRIVAM